jgi:hypothetical protein
MYVGYVWLVDLTITNYSDEVSDISLPIVTCDESLSSVDSALRKYASDFYVKYEIKNVRAVGRGYEETRSTEWF